MSEEKCNAQWCEHWTVNNNCNRCEHNCKHLSHIKTCQLEPTLERCYKVGSCDYKQLQAYKKENEKQNNIVLLMARDITNGEQKIFDSISECIDFYTKKLG